ncbi:acyltransferase domain-containing protein [Mycobacteroides immunogenum]|uniref:ACP S-malonyltransferase n=1 Tax=Mycobacteroides immunogenum TaxID=83262 RepID=UPI0025B75B86|nr:acyltransferase domain-containing protein [Mycobacteroides immunogenum]WJR36126.1 acyltransferase domain-containing protein [Mycobacteroides immunogenum]
MTAFLFPGQGSQHPAMLQTPGLCRASLDDAARFLAIRSELPTLADLDTAPQLENTTNTQLALLIVGVAAARSLTKHWGADYPAVVAGHSVGAFAAAVVAGALTFDEALEAVRIRGQGMERICRQGVWGMAAVIGVTLRQAKILVDEACTDNDPLWIANVNSRRQIVFSGTGRALDRLSACAERAGVTRVEPLDVPVASHGPLLRPVKESLTAYLDGIPERPLHSGYLTNTGSRRVHDSVGVLADLAASVAEPVQWMTIAEILPELGIARAAEMPPGHILTALSAGPDLQVTAVADIGIAATARRLQRQ